MNDDSGASWTHSADVVATGNGQIAYSFRLPDWFVATYGVVATGDESGTATTTFTDGNVRARSNAPGIVFALNWVEYEDSQNCTGTVDDSDSDPTVGFTTGGSSGLFNMGVPNQNSITLQAAATSNAGLVFNGWTGETASDTFIDLGQSDDLRPRQLHRESRPMSRTTSQIRRRSRTTTAYPATEDTTLNVAAPGVLDERHRRQQQSHDGSPCRPARQRPTGTLTLNANGNFMFMPAANFNGAATFTYRANDGIANSDVATVTINVAAVNDAPSFIKGPNQTVAEDAGAPDGRTRGRRLSAPVRPTRAARPSSFVYHRQHATPASSRPDRR